MPWHRLLSSYFQNILKSSALVQMKVESGLLHNGQSMKIIVSCTDPFSFLSHFLILTNCGFPSNLNWKPHFKMGFRGSGTPFPPALGVMANCGVVCGRGCKRKKEHKITKSITRSPTMMSWIRALFFFLFPTSKFPLHTTLFVRLL